MTDDERRKFEWLLGRDTGSSSMAIFAHMVGFNSPPGGRRWWDAPSDPSDLGRCLRLLDLFPEWKPRMPEMANRSPYWAELIKHWEEIVASYDAAMFAKLEIATECYRRMRECRDTSDKIDDEGWVRIGPRMRTRLGGP